jgi:hypothetical protein
MWASAIITRQSAFLTENLLAMAAHADRRLSATNGLRQIALGRGDSQISSEGAAIV